MLQISITKHPRIILPVYLKKLRLENNEIFSCVIHNFSLALSKQVHADTFLELNTHYTWLFIVGTAHFDIWVWSESHWSIQPRRIEVELYDNDLLDWMKTAGAWSKSIRKQQQKVSWCIVICQLAWLDSISAAHFQLIFCVMRLRRINCCVIWPFPSSARW